MKIFLDTANLDQIKKAVEWGVCDGVTTGNLPACSGSGKCRGSFHSGW